MEFPDRISHDELRIRCKEWELAGYLPRAVTMEDHPIKAKLLRVFEPLDIQKPEVWKRVKDRLKVGIDYYWLVAEYGSEWESGNRSWSKQPLPTDRLKSASTLGLLL